MTWLVLTSSDLHLSSITLWVETFPVVGGVGGLGTTVSKILGSCWKKALWRLREDPRRSQTVTPLSSWFRILPKRSLVLLNCFSSVASFPGPGHSVTRAGSDEFKIVGVGVPFMTDFLRIDFSTLLSDLVLALLFWEGTVEVNRAESSLMSMSPSLVGSEVCLLKQEGLL